MSYTPVRLEKRRKELVSQADLSCGPGGKEFTKTGHEEKEKNDHTRDNWKAPKSQLQDMTLDV
jgi:hypothetical protein